MGLVGFCCLEPSIPVWTWGPKRARGKSLCAFSSAIQITSYALPLRASETVECLIFITFTFDAAKILVFFSVASSKAREITSSVSFSFRMQCDAPSTMKLSYDYSYFVETMKWIQRKIRWTETDSIEMRSKQNPLSAATIHAELDVACSECSVELFFSLCRFVFWRRIIISSIRFDPFPIQNKSWGGDWCDFVAKTWRSVFTISALPALIENGLRRDKPNSPCRRIFQPTTKSIKIQWLCRHLMVSAATAAVRSVSWRP